MTDVHLLGDVRRGEVDDDALQTGRDGRTNALNEGGPRDLSVYSRRSERYEFGVLFLSRSEIRGRIITTANVFHD